jgi:hypothetical protein
VQSEDSSQNITHHDIRDPDSGTNFEVPFSVSLESERESSYQNHPCDPAKIENKKKELAFKDKIGL